MKTIIYIFVIITAFAPFSVAQKFKIFEGDTINKVDARNLKQGMWIFFFKNTENPRRKGEYIDSKKEGIWLEYFSSGKLKSEITYTKNKKDGYAKIYYENGKLKEEGLWKINKWVGEYRYYYENGNPNYEWNYNETGTRSGKQKYYHENGNLSIEGAWDEGKENGIIKEYYENGSLKSEKSFENGVINNTKTELYTEKTENIPDTETENNTEIKETKIPEQNNNKKPNVFTGTGFNKFYNKNKLIAKEGNFIKGKLKDGKIYYYDTADKLIKIEIYEDGKVVKVEIIK